MLLAAYFIEPYSLLSKCSCSCALTWPEIPQTGMLDHPITVVLNVFDTLKNNGLKVYKFTSIKTQEEHIGHIKQSKSDRFQDR